MTWMDHYDQLKAFKDRENHCCVPQNLPKYPTLGRWVMAQRRKYKRIHGDDRTSKTAHTSERIKLLDGIGFSWDANRSKGGLWMSRYEDLKKFKDKEGHCCVPRSYFDDPGLANWVNFQRKQYNYMKQGKPSTMTANRAMLLNDIDFTWNMYGDNSQMWMDNYIELKR
eukprot:CAMPEP_0172519810 /NCGR_PEP_ID=MMETSP1066-20121228/291637_1 /TAXON_ID=671091 /ORGANISM="Coscinodiscus wailesii, Strain CCMP2513" /LENGTH=167 /DNA_ID=CAMNT_0013302463 /DNA_START=384 /DNA_END=883 /DNA_ORIENTATION=-